MTKNDFEAIKKEVKKKISEITGVSEDKLKENAKFIEDLEVDSLMALEIVASIEKKYKIVIPEAEIPKIGSLGDVYALLKKKLK